MCICWTNNLARLFHYPQLWIWIEFIPSMQNWHISPVHSSMFVILRCRWSTQLQPFFFPISKITIMLSVSRPAIALILNFRRNFPSLGKRCSSIGFSHSLFRWKSQVAARQNVANYNCRPYWKVLHSLLNVCRSVVKHQLARRTEVEGGFHFKRPLLVDNGRPQIMRRITNSSSSSSSSTTNRSSK